VIGGIGPVPVSVSRTELQGGHTVELLACQAKDPRDRAIVRRRQASYITVVLSKAALSGPSVCLRARAPCPLRVSCTGADRALRVQQSLQATACSASCRPCALPSSPSGTRQVMSPDVQLTHGSGRTVALPYFVPRSVFHGTSLRTVHTHLCLCAKYCGVSRHHSRHHSADRTHTFVSVREVLRCFTACTNGLLC
jgi:hypothetical protein